MKDAVNSFVDRFSNFHTLAPGDQVQRLIYFHTIELGRETVSKSELASLFKLASLPVPKNLPKLLGFLCGRGAKLTSEDGQFALRREVRKAIEEELGAAKPPIVFVDPTQAFEATLSLHDLISGLKTFAKVCDAYFDNTTLEHLHALDRSVHAKVLTKNLRDSGELRRLVAAWKTEGRTLEVRVHASAPLHDRYIIDDETMLILGTSLNGFGKKQCFIIRAGPDLRSSVLTAFDALWGAAAPWP